MTRFAAAANTTASGQAHVPYRIFVDLDFASGILYLCSGDRPYTFNGHTYDALGKLGAVSNIEESADLGPDKLELTLSGVDNSLLVTTLTEKYHGRSVSLYVGYVDANTTDLVATPQLLWEGRMDTMGIRTDEGGSTIALTCENRLMLWNKPSGWNYTHEDQGLLSTVSPDDFFDQVEAIQNKTVKWGGMVVTTGGGGGGGGGGGRPGTTRPS